MQDMSLPNVFSNSQAIEGHAWPGVCRCLHNDESLVDDHETIIRIVRKNIAAVEKLKDAGSMDFLTRIMEQHEKMVWMLRSYLP